MKKICIILIMILSYSCKDNVRNHDLDFVPQKVMNIKNITLLKNNTAAIGSYRLAEDTVVSQCKIQSEYSLVVIKLGNVSPSLIFKNQENADSNTSGYFSIVDEGLYEIKINPFIFNTEEKINAIHFFSDKKIRYQINNDSVKSFDLNFNKFIIKINNNDNKILYGNVEYYGLKNLDAQIVFYQSKSKGYFFIMTPIKEGTVLKKNFLQNYLFYQGFNIHL